VNYSAGAGLEQTAAFYRVWKLPQASARIRNASPRQAPFDGLSSTLTQPLSRITDIGLAHQPHWWRGDYAGRVEVGVYVSALPARNR
jgi:hypothetical protein